MIFHKTNMSIKKIYYILILFLLQTACIPAFAENVKLSVDAGRRGRNIEVNNLFYIYMDIADIDAVPETPKNVPGAKIMYFERTGQSSSFTSINGKVSQSTSYRYTLTLRAEKEGSYSFGPITVGGVRSNVINYTIAGASQSTDNYGGNSRSSGSSSNSSNNSNPADASDNKPKYIGKGDGNLFLRANVSNTTVYEQQALVYTVKLYTTYDAIKFIGAAAAPKFEGFVVEESKDISSSLTYETYNGKTYATAVIARYIIFPQMTGQLKVLGNTYTVSVDQREYYHDPFWGSLSYSTPLQLNVTPNDLTVNVRSLPTPKPADFSGGVGNFSIESKLQSSNFKSNVPGSIIYTVKGTGNLKYIQLPDLNAIYPSELEVYTPKTNLNTTVGSTNVNGSVSFDYSFIPMEEGIFKIPEIRLVYFNPESGKYETSTAKGYNITVGKGVSSSKSQVNRKLQFKDNLKPVKYSDIHTPGKPWISTFGYWLIYIVIGSGIIIFIICRHIYMNSHSDMVAFNSKRANRIARKRLKTAYNCIKRDDRESFYTEMLKALWGYMGDKLKMPTSELMRDNIRQVLEHRSVPDNVIRDFINLLDTCEFAKYSPAENKDEMMITYKNAINEINAIEKSVTA